jgi:RimJ/RimL family protein N-acetyltransferase
MRLAPFRDGWLTAIGDIEQLLAVDGERHDALVTVNPDTGRALAIGRFVRDPADDTVAEVAFEVVDPCQGRGLGGLLVGRLAERARALGIERFSAFVLSGNQRARAVLQRIGRLVSSRREGVAVELTIELG